MDWEKLRATVRTAVPLPRPGHRHQLLPEREAAASNPRWRPVGLGLMGLQDVFFALRLPFDCERGAQELSTRIAEEIYLTALEMSAELAAEHGRAPGVRRDAGGRGRLQPDLWDVPRRPRPSGGPRCARRSPSTACATRCSSPSRRRRRSPRSPAATSASSRRCRTCSSARRCRGSSSRSTRALVARAQGALGLWTEPRSARPIKRAEGSVQGIAALPDGRAAAVPHRVGAAAEGADRHRRRPGALHRPEPVAQPVPGQPRRSGSSARCTCTPGRPA